MGLNSIPHLGVIRKFLYIMTIYTYYIGLLSLKVQFLEKNTNTMDIIRKTAKSVTLLRELPSKLNYV